MNTALAAAAINGEPAPTGVTITLTTVGQENAALVAAGVPMLTLAGAGGPGYEAYLASQEYVVVMHGHFTLNSAQLTPGMPAPTGTTLQITIEPHTGQITSTRLLPS